MINLIPKTEKKKIVREFYIKLMILSLVILGGVFLLAFFAVLPSYFLSSAKHNIINDKLQAQRDEPVPVPDQQTLAAIGELNHKISLVEKSQKNEFFISKNIINAVVLKKIPNIKITNISFEDDAIKGKTVGVEGTAPSREVLLLFRKALEDDPSFKTVDLPVSNFIKGSNIKFFLSITLK